MIGAEAQQKIDQLIIGLCDFFLKLLESNKPIVLDDLNALTRLITAANGKSEFIALTPNGHVKQSADIDRIIKNIEEQLEQQLSKGAYA